MEEILLHGIEVALPGSHQVVFFFFMSADPRLHPLSTRKAAQTSHHHNRVAN